MGAEEAQHAGEGGPGNVADLLLPSDSPAVLHVTVLPVDALLTKAHYPPYLVGQSSWLLIRMVTASCQHHLGTLNLIKDLVKFFFINILSNGSGCWMERDPSSEV